LFIEISLQLYAVDVSILFMHSFACFATVMMMRH